jgi:hypothetical protein
MEGGHTSVLMLDYEEVCPFVKSGHTDFEFRQPSRIESDETVCVALRGRGEGQEHGEGGDREDHGSRERTERCVDPDSVFWSPPLPIARHLVYLPTPISAIAI